MQLHKRFEPHCVPVAQRLFGNIFFSFFFLFLLFHILVQVTHSVRYFSILVNKQCMYVCIYVFQNTFFCLCLLRLAFIRLVAFFRASFLDGGSLPVHFHIKTPHIFRLSSFFFFLQLLLSVAGTSERMQTGGLVLTIFLQIS